jgi:hypothetical protein
VISRRHRSQPHPEDPTLVSDICTDQCVDAHQAQQTRDSPSTPTLACETTAPKTGVCVFRLFSTKPQPAGGTCHGPGQLQLLGLWAIPSTESGPQPPLVTYNPSSLTLTPSPPPLYVCMYMGVRCRLLWYVRGYVVGGRGSMQVP